MVLGFGAARLLLEFFFFCGFLEEEAFFIECSIESCPVCLVLIAVGGGSCLPGVSCFFPGETFSGVLILLPLVVLLDGATSNFSASFVIDGDLINPLAWAGEPSSFDDGVLNVRLRDVLTLLFFLLLKSPSSPSSVEDSWDFASSVVFWRKKHSS